MHEWVKQGHDVNSLAPVRFQRNFTKVILQLILVIDGWSISCKIVLKWMPMDLADGLSTLVQVMAWCRQAISHYLSQCWPRSLSPSGVTWPQWVNLGWCHMVSWNLLTHLWPNETMWRHRSVSALAQAMACCLMVSSHYLNKCWLIISEVLWHLRAISQEVIQTSVLDLSLKINNLRLELFLLGASEWECWRMKCLIKSASCLDCVHTKTSALSPHKTSAVQKNSANWCHVWKRPKVNGSVLYIW